MSLLIGDFSSTQTSTVPTSSSIDIYFSERVTFAPKLFYNEMHKQI